MVSQADYHGEDMFLACLLALAVADNLWYLLACRCSTPTSAFFIAWCISVPVSKLSSSDKGTSLSIMAHPNSILPHLNLVTSAKTVFSS